MTNFELLQAKIKESGMTMVAICEKSGIERATMYNRLNGVGDFKGREIHSVFSVFHFTF